MAELSGQTTLLGLRPAGRAAHPSILTGNTVLPMLGTTGMVEFAPGAQIHTTLKMLKVRGVIQPVVHKLRGQTKLPKLRSIVSLRSAGRIIFLTGQVRATGGSLLTFLGPPDRTVRWSVIEGGGAVIPVRDYTDSWGRATALYQAGGFAGKVVVQVEYGR